MYSNYPSGMSHSDLQYVGDELECDNCWCSDPKEPLQIDPESLNPCWHPDACGCDGCDCECHREWYD